jgi:hypothetical protein
MPTVSAVVAAFTTIYEHMRPLLLLLLGVVLGMLVAYRKQQLPVELLAVLALALAMVVLTANTAWVQMNEFEIRYFLPAVIVVASIMGYLLTQALMGVLYRSCARDFAVAIASICAVPALGNFDSEFNELVAPDWRQTSRILATAALDQGVRVIAGDYWLVWPTIYEAERLSDKYGTPRSQVYGATFRGHVLRDEFIRSIGENVQKAFCLFDRVEACKKQLIGTFGTESFLSVNVQDVERININGVPVIKLSFIASGKDRQE